MNIKKWVSLLLAFVLCVSSFGMTSMAAGADPQTEGAVVFGTGRFHMDVPGGTLVKANSSFLLEAGETVTIKASYSPFSANLDFGLIAPDGYFYYVNVTGGSFDETIRVDERGNYTFAVMNHSSQTVSVSGYVSC